MQVGVWKVSPDKAKGVEAIQEGLHRPAGGEAERATEVAILDERQLRRMGPGDVIAVSDRGQCAGRRGGHPVHVSLRSTEVSRVAAVEKRLDVVGEPLRVLVWDGAHVCA